MTRLIRIAILVVAGAVWFTGGFTEASNSATTVSSGCAALQAKPTTLQSFNDEDDYFLFAGDTIGAAMTGFFAGYMSVNGTIITGPANTTLSYVIPSTGTYHVLFGVSEDTDVTFDYFCTPTLLALGPCDGGPPPAGYRVVNGTPGNDVIYIGSGNAVVYGNGGNDRVYGGSGNDFVFGGDGDDYVSGGSGNDCVDGGAGNDYVDCGSGTDTCHGQGGNDTVDCGSGNDQCSGETGTDRLYGSTGTDVCNDPDASTYKNSCESSTDEQPPPQGNATTRTRARA
jgi:Ca2+-binding RTX toxin-like protein